MIDNFLQREIDAGTFPSAVYAIGDSRGIRYEGALGNAVCVPFRIPSTLTTIYDCASLTKPLITATLVLQASAEGRIDLDVNVSSVLPEVRQPFTFAQLLAHTSGLRTGIPLYAARGYLERLAEEPLQHAPGTHVIYSDPNFVVLYYALTRIYGDYVERAVRCIFEPAGTIDAMFRPPAGLRCRIAATEWGQRYEAALPTRRNISFAGFRDHLIWGETHDGNSHHHGGTAGNSGLFASARDIFRIARRLLGGTLLGPSLFERSVTSHTQGLNEQRGLGWALREEGNPVAAMLSDDSFGHNGFTGTSLWIDRQRDWIMVLLTNRVHPCAGATAITNARVQFHELALRLR